MESIVSSFFGILCRLWEKVCGKRNNTGINNSWRREFSFMWWIENVSYRYTGRDKVLYSPNFTLEGMSDTSWFLSSDPFIPSKGEYGYLNLHRSFFDAGPEYFPLKFEISVMKADGSILSSKEYNYTFINGDRLEFMPFLMYKWNHTHRKTDHLPGDTLGVRCRMRMGGEDVQMVRQCTARTRIGIENISFLYRVENFSALKRGEKKILQIYSPETGCFFTSTLCLEEIYWNVDMVNVEISSSNNNYRLYIKKLYVINVSGNIIELLKRDDQLSFSLQRQYLTRQFLMDKSEEFLPNDELSLLCECTLPTGVNHGTIVEILRDIPVASFKQRYDIPQSRNDKKAAEKLSSLPSASEDTKLNHSNQHLSNVNLNENTLSKSSNAASRNLYGIYNQVINKDPHKKKYNAAEKLCMCPSALDDFKALYSDKFLTDVVLKTTTNSFSAHKNVLCARSSVFRAMLTNDMKEKNTDCIKVEDLEYETVQRLLLFLYSDSLEELQWESAIQLYYAADKYAIEKLKFLCSTFLVENLSTSTASELLLLADTHNDTELKKIVEDFILKNEREVFDSVQWEKLSETNPQLVIKTMKLKYKRKKGGKGNIILEK
ncbi:unnamed protein product [Larinioides sclopetarius]|uniref:BTB domain-containing protein n=1 Tax=Larinioides sclopetarius TaxID=280406 RepID=A0AAV2ACT2_9ARAC